MQTTRVLAVLLLLCAVAQAAWVGDVADLIDPNTGTAIPANTVVINAPGNPYHGATYATPWLAYADAPAGSQLLCGPGVYIQTSTQSGQPVWTKAISVVGSGSGTDPASNTVFRGAKDANGLEVYAAQFFQYNSITNAGLLFKDFRMEDNCNNGMRIQGGTYTSVLFENLSAKNVTHQLPSHIIPTDAGRLADQDSGGPGQFGIRWDGWNYASTTITLKDSWFDDFEGVGYMNTRDNGNLTIQGNTFSNMKAGVQMNNQYAATNIKIINNTFDNISERVGLEEYGMFGNSGIIFLPRVGGTFTNVLIAGNTFSDCGYIADETSPLGFVDSVIQPTDSHTYEDRLLGEAGVQFVMNSGSYATNVLIRNNTFVENAGDDGVMERGVAIWSTNLAGWNFGDQTWAGASVHTWSGTPGYVSNISVVNNTFTGLQADIYGTYYTNDAKAGDIAVTNLYYSGNAPSGITGGFDVDVDNDGDVDGYDITNCNVDLDGSGTVTAADKDLVVTAVLKTYIGDYNLDGIVSGGDFVVWSNNYPSASGKNWGTGDGDHSGGVSGADFVKWSNNYPQPTNWWYPPAGAAVPEPATMALLALGGLALIRRRR